MYKVNDVITVTIQSINDFGAFALTDDGLMGLIHISQISHHYISDIHNYLSLYQKVEVKVIGVDFKSNLSLSIKALNNRSIQRDRIKILASEEPKIVVGFQSLAEKITNWIEEGENKYEN